MSGTALDPNFSVSPQIGPEDVAGLRDAGFTDLVCNRPDSEIPGGPVSAEMERAARAAGLRFHYLPISPGQFGDDLRTAFARLAADPSRRVFAYCRSGQRSAALWALATGSRERAESLIRHCAARGYNLEPLRPLFRPETSAA
jgi:sulfide:quinone oxidoreductase